MDSRSPFAFLREYATRWDAVALVIVIGFAAFLAAPFNGSADLPKIAHDLQMEIDDLFPVAETLQMMRLAEVGGGDIRLTEAGVAFAHAGVDELEDVMSEEAAEQTLSAVVTLGRYAEVFAYDDDRATFSLENPV